MPPLLLHHNYDLADEPLSRGLMCRIAAQDQDLVATGSDDGELKLWKIAADFKSVSQVFAYEVPGFINDIRFSTDGSLLAIAAGQEHRDGRWWVSTAGVLFAY
ncbi:unnamed protein product [Nippostrongylus brasiliensis]|uniref:U3 small nucleolar RNA-interacting protein 2 (inferred by orthology to a human protein) n=1 Tax=Nippostrongylus brasiliensis TaxID=27835 RepID=A0A0N4XVP0_NIPBR|nr:unnamed protein product [Nippostrongylus brasiliensis]